MSTEDFYVVKYRNDDRCIVRTCPSGRDPLEWVCCEAAETICFGDCSDEEVILICVNGRELKYCGWQPDMLYEFKDVVTGEVVFSAHFPRWEH